ncbi:TetR/AcrR family transcriptional regulator [Microbacterium sp. Sa4CUA7]|uniref:TetR/AcrR family transcriptional regulator n=1 Tax=Microbacterium pullorum TaxID=2762236 RepID=A0ABR8S2L4_9MICO|nr:TetR/AcrR family transcriptional regulator [Microbacterium pullorum]MBD7957722.1 TetR/AcrR family transcriptional regulator [Microbacterium pullorum]
MSVASPRVGRRERNKQEKRERIVAAAGALFAERGIDDVTTQQIADAADIGTGTLFLYAKTKGELLLLVQNAHYLRALEEGRAAAAETTGAVDGVLAVLAPIVACNRTHVDNGRTYLREMVFGDATEPHHAEALRIVDETERDVAALIVARAGRSEADATVLARVISSGLVVTMASASDPQTSVAEVVAAVRRQVEVILAGDRYSG